MNCQNGKYAATACQRQRHRVEAEAALDGGAELIDVKEPKNGPMGRADDSIIQSIVQTIAGRAPLSAACGELRPEPQSLPGGLEFAKFGLAGWADGDWLSTCERVRRDSLTAANLSLLPTPIGDHAAPHPRTRSPMPRSNVALVLS